MGKSVEDALYRITKELEELNKSIEKTNYILLDEMRRRKELSVEEDDKK